MPSTSAPTPARRWPPAASPTHAATTIGWALAVSVDSQLLLASWAYEGNRHDSNVFAAAVPGLRERLKRVGIAPEQVTVVFDNPNNAASNLAQVDDAGLGFVGSLAPTQHPDLLDVTDECYTPVEDIDAVTA
jgi:transposase